MQRRQVEDSASETQVPESISPRPEQNQVRMWIVNDGLNTIRLWAALREHAHQCGCPKTDG